MSLFLNFLDTVKKKNRLVVGICLLISGYFGEAIYAIVKEEIVVISKVDRKLYELDERVTSVEIKLDKFSALEDQVVMRSSFNAYIARKDEEFHIQDAFNDQITKGVGELSGKMGLLEKLVFIDTENICIDTRRRGK